MRYNQLSPGDLFVDNRWGGGTRARVPNVGDGDYWLVLSVTPTKKPMGAGAARMYELEHGQQLLLLTWLRPKTPNANPIFIETVVSDAFIGLEHVR